jgi:hypothetical protein
MIKKELEENIKEEIIKLSNEKISKRKIAEKFNISTSLIDRILKDSLMINNKDFLHYEEDENFKFVAKCKNTGKIFEDLENKSGSITNFIKETYTNFIIPSAFKRRDSYKKTGIYWYEEFLDIIKVEKKHIETKKCQYCEWTTIDLLNKSGMYGIHIEKNHNITIENHVKDYPEDKEYFLTQLKNYKNRFINKKEDKDFIFCKICNEKLSRITNTHLKKHNLNLLEYKNQFGIQGLYSEKVFRDYQLSHENNLKYSGNNFTSKSQIEISNLLKDSGIENELNNKKLLKGIEIDILCEDNKYGIEYNGNYWHSEITGKKDKNFHLNKSNLMKNAGYNLLHIFEDEWENKKEILKSKILHIFNVNSENSKIIHARKCKIDIIESFEKKNFLNNYHIQGNDVSDIFIGAKFEGELIAVMTFDSLRNMMRKTKEDEYELKRFCCKKDCIITGIASRMLKYFIKNNNPKKIISFADIRWTPDVNSNMYVKLGFELSKVMKPDYTYYHKKSHNNKRLHKFGFGKISLKKKFPELYDDNKTEWQIMQEAGYDRIWDCGKYKFELKF